MPGDEPQAVGEGAAPAEAERPARPPVVTGSVLLRAAFRGLLVGGPPALLVLAAVGLQAAPLALALTVAGSIAAPLTLLEEAAERRRDPKAHTRAAFLAWVLAVAWVSAAWVPVVYAQASLAGGPVAGIGAAWRQVEELGRRPGSLVIALVLAAGLTLPLAATVRGRLADRGGAHVGAFGDAAALFIMRVVALPTALLTLLVAASYVLEGHRDDALRMLLILPTAGFFYGLGAGAACLWLVVVYAVADALAERLLRGDR